MAKLLGSVKGGVHTFDQNWETVDTLNSLEGERTVSDIKIWKNTRTNRQNRYYFGVVVPASFQALTDIGIKLVNEKQAHRAMQCRFLMEDVEYDGGVFQVPKSTADLDVEEFANYIFVVVELLRDKYNCIVPEPTGSL